MPVRYLPVTAPSSTLFEVIRLNGQKTGIFVEHDRQKEDSVIYPAGWETKKGTKRGVPPFRNEGAFRTAGGFNIIDRQFGGGLQDVLDEINQYFYDDGGTAAL